ncbi:MAG: glycosyltransferase family 4 protein [Lentisphaerota bacterium]
MKLAFCIFKYFPYGGLQGDFLRIATECLRRGHEVIVYTRSWDGVVPEGLDIRLIKAGALTNHGKAIAFYKQLRHELQSSRPAGIIGFNRIPGLDVYFAGDNCLAEKAEKRFFYRTFNPRYRTYAYMEKIIFSPSAHTEILYIAEPQKTGYIKHYATQAQRFHLLPPGIPEDRRRSPESAAIREIFRKTEGIAADEHILLQVGSGFIAKGVDRSIRAVAALPDNVRRKTRLWIAGKDNPRKFIKLAESLGIASQVVFLGGRNDIPALLAGADLMIHPAIDEAAGNVLLEAMTAGLPVLCTAACGHSPYIEESDAGTVLPGPFSQSELNQSLLAMLNNNLPAIGEKGVAFARQNNFYSRHIVAADIIEKAIAAKTAR